MENNDTSKKEGSGSVIQFELPDNGLSAEIDGNSGELLNKDALGVDGVMEFMRRKSEIEKYVRDLNRVAPEESEGAGAVLPMDKRSQGIRAKVQLDSMIPKAAPGSAQAEALSNMRDAVKIGEYTEVSPAEGFEFELLTSRYTTNENSEGIETPMPAAYGESVEDLEGMSTHLNFSIASVKPDSWLKPMLVSACDHVEAKLDDFDHLLIGLESEFDLPTATRKMSDEELDELEAQIKTSETPAYDTQSEPSQLDIITLIETDLDNMMSGKDVIKPKETASKQASNLPSAELKAASTPSDTKAETIITPPASTVDVHGSSLEIGADNDIPGLTATAEEEKSTSADAVSRGYNLPGQSGVQKASGTGRADGRKNQHEPKYMSFIQEKKADMKAYLKIARDVESTRIEIESAETGLETVISDLDDALVSASDPAEKRIKELYTHVTKERINLEKKTRDYVEPVNMNEALDAAGKYLRHRGDTDYFTKLPEILTQGDLEEAFERFVEIIKEPKNQKGVFGQRNTIAALAPLMDNVLSRTYAVADSQEVFDNKKDRRIITKLYDKALSVRRVRDMDIKKLRKDIIQYIKGGTK